MSTPKFHTLSIKDIRQETKECVSIALQIPEDLADLYQYQAGQYITFKHLHNDGKEIRRSYSVCSSPLDGELRVAIKKVPNGIFSTYANTQLKKGDKVEVMTPMGHFTPEDAKSKKAYYGFASGSGITPILSIIKTVLKSNEDCTFTLIYGNKNVRSIIFKEELEGLKNIYLDRFRVIHILSRERTEVDLNFGRINKEKCNLLFDKLLDADRIDEAFICGPEEMTLEVKEFLLSKGLTSNQIKFELFGTGKAQQKQVKTAANEDQGPISKVSIKVDDRTFDIELGYKGDNILDAALANGADLPYACKGGVCCTCRAKVVEGKVNMLVNYALQPDEVEAGFVLTCQAHPASERVVIDFDVS